MTAINFYRESVFLFVMMRGHETWVISNVCNVWREKWFGFVNDIWRRNPYQILSTDSFATIILFQSIFLLLVGNLVSRSYCLQHFSVTSYSSYSLLAAHPHPGVIFCNMIGAAELNRDLGLVNCYIIIICGCWLFWLTKLNFSLWPSIISKLISTPPPVPWRDLLQFDWWCIKL